MDRIDAQNVRRGGEGKRKRSDRERRTQAGSKAGTSFAEGKTLQSADALCLYILSYFFRSKFCRRQNLAKFKCFALELLALLIFPPPEQQTWFRRRASIAQRTAKRKRKSGQIEQYKQNGRQIDMQPQRVFGILYRFRRMPREESAAPSAGHHESV